VKPAAKPTPPTETPPAAAEAPVATVPTHVQKYLDSVPVWKDGRHEWDPETGAVTTTLPSGRVARTKFDADAEIAAMAKKKGRGAVKGAYVYRTGKRGQYEEGTIYLASNATHETLNHEAVHWMEDNGIVTANEVAQYGGREGLAKSYAEWAVDHKEPNGLFRRIYDMLEKLFSARRKLFEDIGRREAGPKPKPTETAPSAQEADVDVDNLFDDAGAGAFPAVGKRGKTRGTGEPKNLAAKWVELKTAQGERANARNIEKWSSRFVSHIDTKLANLKNKWLSQDDMRVGLARGTKKQTFADTLTELVRMKLIKMAWDKETGTSYYAHLDVALPENLTTKEPAKSKAVRKRRVQRGDAAAQLQQVSGELAKKHGMKVGEVKKLLEERLPETQAPVRETQGFLKDIHTRTKLSLADLKKIAGLDWRASKAAIEEAVGTKTSRDREAVERLWAGLRNFDTHISELEREYHERLGDGDVSQNLWDALLEEIPNLPESHDDINVEALSHDLEESKAAKEEFPWEKQDIGFDVGDEGVDPELSSTVIGIAKDTVKAGIYDFATFVKRVADKIGRDLAINIAPQLRKLWDGASAKHPKMDQSSSVKAILRDTPRPVAPAVRATGQTAGTEQTSVKHANVEASRTQRGDYLLESDDKKTFEEWADEARGRITDDPNWMPRLIEQLKINPRTLEAIETAGLAVHYTAAKNSFERMAKQLQTQKAAGADPVAIVEAQTNADTELARLRTIEEIAREVGTAAGRALVSRKITLERDYTLASLTLEAVAAKGGENPTARESEQIATLVKEIEQLKAKLAKAEQQESVEAADQAIADVPKPAKKPPKPREPRKGAKKAIKDAAVAAKNVVIERMRALLKGNIAFDVGDKGGGLGTDPEVKATAVLMAKAYIGLEVATFAEFVARVHEDLGIDVVQSRNSLREAWGKAGGASESARPSVDKGDLRAVSKLAKQIMRLAVESGITEREAVVDVVYEELQEAGFPDITRQQAMDAMSGYGDFRPLPMDEVSVILRDIRGQLQQLGKLEDMASGEAPKKTGPERRQPSEEERHLIQQVNEAKKRGGFEVTDPATQLKSALASAKTAVKNRIADMTAEIEAGEKIVRERTSLKADAELTALRQQRDALREVWDQAFPKQPMTDAQRIALAVRGINRTIATLEADLKAGRLGAKPRGRKLSSPELAAGRARLDALKAQREELRANNPKYQADLEARQNAAYKASLLNRLADWKQRIADKDFAPKPKAERKVSKEVSDIQYRIEQEKTKFRKWQQQWMEARMTPVQKVGLVATRTIQLSRAVVSSVDLSALARQGLVGALARPGLASRATPGMLKAFWSQQQAFRESANLNKRANRAFYDRCGLAIISEDAGLGPQAEEFRGEWSDKVPVVAGSQRAYVTFLNRLRADWFDIMVDNLGADGQVTLEQGKIIARFVNAGTGRGGLGKLETSAGALATAFFSPRLFMSRIQILSGYYALGNKHGTRTVILKEYARVGAGLAAVYSLWAIARAMWPDDDEEHKPTVTFDPRSSDFGKLRIGNLRFDILG